MQTVNRRTFIKGSAAGALVTMPIARERALAQEAKHLPAGYAMVTSLRLPLAGIGAADLEPIISGDTANWSDVGCALSVPIVPMAIDGIVPAGLTPTETATDYDDLITKLDMQPGGFAVVPLDQIDFRVNTLKVNGIDPLLASGTDDAPVARIGAVGDIIPGRNVAAHIRAFGDYSVPLQRTKHVLSSFDFTFANFECFISETLEFPELVDANALDFVTRPDFVPTMVDAGIGAVSMANNHAVYSWAGWGLPAFEDTYGFLTNGGVPVFGAGNSLEEARKPFVTEVHGLSVALLGVDGITGNETWPYALGVVADAGSQATDSHGGTNPLNLPNVVADIEKLVAQYDIVIPFFHMSEQYYWTPQDWAVETGRQCIDAGATCVVSSHPHTIQGWESYHGKPIFYGIGNFIYDQMFSVDTRQGYVLELTFRGREVVSFRIHAHEIEDFTQPRFMGQGELAAFMDRFWLSSDMLTKQFG
ncbi:MAG: CapA family protein [Thermomicrobiales bacterium]|nr:CapA family protein [Thermomicrobiales bacterium]MCO5226827.1 CapA family protein [Thermomicrobiales bacterium]